jgi:uncharacterized alpha-E superfamily protein
MLSRSADHLFWMARYLERTERCAAGAAASPADLRAAQVKVAQRPAGDTTPSCAQRSVFRLQGAA